VDLTRLLRPAPHQERGPAQHALLVLVGAGLALAAVIGIAWAAGFTTVYDQLVHLDPLWLPVAFGMEVAAYFGYVVAYREIARVQGGPRLGIGRAGAIVAAGFGVFVIRGGFAVDRHALEDAGLEPREARIRVLGLGALEYAVLAPAAALAAVIILARGSTHPSLGFTLPWAIAVPLGFIAAFAALGLRHRVRDEGGWRAALRHALDAVNMLRDHRHHALLGRRYRLPLGVPPSVPRLAGHRGAHHRLRDRLRADSEDVAARRRRFGRGARLVRACVGRNSARASRPRRLCISDLQSVAPAPAGSDRPAPCQALARGSDDTRLGDL
jgi:hypothetical protein